MGKGTSVVRPCGLGVVLRPVLVAVAGALVLRRLGQAWYGR